MCDGFKIKLKQDYWCDRSILVMAGEFEKFGYISWLDF